LARNLVRIRVSVTVRGLAKPAGAVGAIDAVGAIVQGSPQKFL